MIKKDPPIKTSPPAPSDGEVKPVYEHPVVVPLGELIKGSGNCTSGSYPVGQGGNCKAGGTAGVNNCISGPTPRRNCNIGGIPH